jgi:hypothetical protein
MIHHHIRSYTWSPTTPADGIKLPMPAMSVLFPIPRPENKVDGALEAVVK